MKRTTTGIHALSLCLAAAVLAGCGGPSTGGGKAEFVDGGTFTLATSSDPGNLDPQMGAGTTLFTVSQFAYDPLVSVDGKTGEIKSGLAKSWDVKGTTITLTLNADITCSDGAKLTATDVARNLDFVADPASKSPFTGTFFPAGAKSVADDAAATVTVTLAAPAPFVAGRPLHLHGPRRLQVGPRRRHHGDQGPAEDGRGQGRAERDDGGEPAAVRRPERRAGVRTRRRPAGEVRAVLPETPALVGEQWYNHGEGRVTSDPKVRKALTQALDLAQLRKVLTSDQGGPATTLAANEPVACTGDSVSKALPAFDAKAAAALLDEAGWKAGADGKRTKDATARSQDETTLTSTIFGAGDWDVTWVSLNVSSPDQLVPFLSGPAAPAGTNFSAISDPEYDKAVTAAMAVPGVEGCSGWLAAESGLIAKSEIVPFASKSVRTFGKGAEFQTPGLLIPTSIRVLAK